MILRTDYRRGRDGKPEAANSLDVFLKVENATISLIAKTLNPIIGPTADHNFVESLNFAQRLNDTTIKNGVGVQRMAYRLTNLNDDIRDKFVEVAGAVYERNVPATPPRTRPGGVSDDGRQPDLREGAQMYNSRIAPWATPPVQSPILRGVQPASYHDYQYGFRK